MSKVTTNQVPERIQLCDAGAELLRSAIVITAIEDYRNPKSEYSKESLERFLLSDWGQLLSGDIGQYIVENLRKGE